ncbi:MAG: S8 family serine peptidase [Colwellia sp.]
MEAPDHSDITSIEESIDYEDENIVIRQNNQIMTPYMLDQVESQIKKGSTKKRKKRKVQRQANARKLLKNRGWKESSLVAQQIKNGRQTLTLELSKKEIEELLENENSLVSGVDLYVPSQDGSIADAMLNTTIDPWALNYSTRQGNNIGIYMTESGCANNGHITDYTRLAGSRTNHAENVSGIIRAVSPESYIYCRGGAVLPQSTDLDGVSGNPPIHIVTRSNGSQTSDDYTILDRDWDDFAYNEHVLTLVAAGNEGNSTDEIRAPGKALNILTVGAYDHDNNTIATFSSANNPETGNQKPEVSAPGVSITAGGHTMSGTSMSTPHVAGLAADVMSHYSWYRFRPARLKALIMGGAIQNITGGANAVGSGGIDFRETHYRGSSSFWRGSNSWFTGNSRYNSSTGLIERTVTIDSKYDNARVVITWLNRGAFTFDHRDEVHPMGMDFDLQIFDPNGNLVGSSASFDNPFEEVNFNPTVSGVYTVKIARSANRDTSAKFDLGLKINWW